MESIRRYSQVYVISNDKILFNTNNHWDNGRPDNYRYIVDRYNTSNWIDRFHKDNYFFLTLDRDDLKWMEDAFRIGITTRKFSHLFDDELEITCDKHREKMNDINKHLSSHEKGWFVRTENVSLKEGQFGIGPYDNLENIIKSMVSSTAGHYAFGETDTECIIYFMRWVDMDYDKEFRIFVYNNKITAISAQHLYSINKWLNSMSDEEIGGVVYKILQYFEEHIKDKLFDFENYTMDLALIGDDETPYFIEPNSFGSEYASGSSLFHWINDHDILHGNGPLELRYVSDN